MSALILAVIMAQSGPVPANTPPIVALPVVTTPDVPATVAAHKPPAPAANTATYPGDIIVSAPIVRPTKADPLAKTNAQVFAVVDKLDTSFVAPVANGYKAVVPSPLRAGVRNALHNIKTPVLLVNNVLQLRPKGTADVLVRFVVNTAMGWGGLFDVAKRKPFNRPYINNGFSYTLGYYGVKSGPYFYLPLIGPTTLRDSVGGLVDAAINPALVKKPFDSPYYTFGVGTARALDARIEFDDKVQLFRQTDSAYISERDWYLKTRQDEIDALHGRKPAVTLAPKSTDQSSPPVPATAKPPN